MHMWMHQARRGRTLVTRGGSMPPIRGLRTPVPLATRSAHNPLLFFIALCTAGRSSLAWSLNAHYAARTHACNLLTRQNAHPRTLSLSLSLSLCAATGPSTLPMIRPPRSRNNRSSIRCTMQRKEKGMLCAASRETLPQREILPRSLFTKTREIANTIRQLRGFIVALYVPRVGHFIELFNS